jgi:hypothetical protein
LIQKPFNINIKSTTIDVNITNLIKWKVTGAFPVAYSIDIYNNIDSTLVYSVPKTASSKIEHLLDDIVLSNGNEYKIVITVWDESNNSAMSDAEIFQTSSTPQITIENIGLVGSSSYNFFATYSQAELVGIKSWIAILYDTANNIKQKSTLQTNNVLSYLFDNLEAEKDYFVEFQATSEKGLTGTSGLVPFEVYYSRPNMSINLEAENVADASIRLKWFVTQIIGESAGANYISGEKIDVRNEAVFFNNGFKIVDDFTLKIWVESVDNVVISDIPEFTKQLLQPSNISALWMLSDSGTPQDINFIKSASPPTSLYNLWISDSSASSEETLGLNIGEFQPTTQDVIWYSQSNIKEKLYVFKLAGDNGYLSLNYYNGAFHLYKNEDGVVEIIDSLQINETSYFIYLQQIGETYNLFAQLY